MKKILSASILNADFACFQAELKTAVEAGIDWVHLDIMDGHFVPNISMGPSFAHLVRRLTKLPIDAHLMISNPDEFIDKFAEAKIDTISVHIEENPHIHRTLQHIRDAGCNAGIVLNPGTPAESISEVLHMVSLVLVMTVNPGFGGQDFIQEVLPKIKKVKNMIEKANSKALIQVDGGINKDTIALVGNAGTSVFVAGSAIFHHPDGTAQGVKDLLHSIHSLPS